MLFDEYTSKCDDNDDAPLPSIAKIMSDECIELSNGSTFNVLNLNNPTLRGSHTADTILIVDDMQSIEKKAYNFVIVPMISTLKTKFIGGIHFDENHLELVGINSFVREMSNKSIRNESNNNNSDDTEPLPATSMTSCVEFNKFIEQIKFSGLKINPFV